MNGHPWLFAVAVGIISACFLGLIGATYMALRNDWVFKKRMEAIDAPDYPASYRSLPSYDEMMRRFWVWDVKKFRK